MIAAEVVEQLAAAGCAAWADGDVIRLKGRKPAATILATLTASKPEVLALLRTAGGLKAPNLLAGLGASPTMDPAVASTAAPADPVSDAKVQRDDIEVIHNRKAGAAASPEQTSAEILEPARWPPVTASATLPDQGAVCVTCAGSVWWAPRPGAPFRCHACCPPPHGWPLANDKAPAARSAAAAAARLPDESGAS